jgi:hypothetical protein
MRWLSQELVRSFLLQLTIHLIIISLPRQLRPPHIFNHQPAHVSKAGWSTRPRGFTRTLHAAAFRVAQTVSTSPLYTGAPH